MNATKTAPVAPDFDEIAEWIEAFDQLVKQEGSSQGTLLLDALTRRARESGVDVPVKLNTPYRNTIPVEDEVPYPGNREVERRVKSLIRWNAMAMVHRQNKEDAGIGGHISTYSSLAALLEVGFNHFFHASYGDQPGDFVYFQGHASPGVYARAFLEGRLTEDHLRNFRHELREAPGLSSYPHPWLMPEFWSFPTVSMGLGPLNAIYQARFMRYLENRSLIAKTPRKVWAFVGDGETDEPESMGSLTLASREKLDNLVFVVNCNLQRLDGPVRGNGKIINELEAAFSGAGWNVIKVIWSSDWDPLLAQDTSGLLQQRMEECVDGEYQSFKAKGGTNVREAFFGKYPETLALVEHPRRSRDTALVRPRHATPHTRKRSLATSRSRRSASVLIFPFLKRPRKKGCPTVRRMTVPKSATCTSEGSNWAATCPHALSLKVSSRRLRSSFSRNLSPVPRAAPSPQPWVLSACCAI